MSSLAWTVATGVFIALCGFSTFMAYTTGRTENAAALKEATSKEVTFKRVRDSEYQEFISTIRSADRVYSYFPRINSFTLSETDYDKTVEALPLERTSLWYTSKGGIDVLQLLNKKFPEEFNSDKRTEDLILEYFQYLELDFDYETQFHHLNRAFENYLEHGNEQSERWFITVLYWGKFGVHSNENDSSIYPEIKMLLDNNPGEASHVALKKLLNSTVRFSENHADPQGGNWSPEDGKPYLDSFPKEKRE